MSLIELRGIAKNYGATQALSGVDLVIGTGITGLLGPNGAGKSTLIKVLLGLISVTQGSGTVLGLPLGKAGRAIRAKVGYVPEDDCYLPGLTGIEVVQFAACLSGLPEIEALRRSHEILDFCGMKQERYRTVETYSTGMRQKIKFAAAIVHDPEYLILDEPTSGLDPEERDSLLNRIRILARQAGKSVLLSTHILHDVQSTCDHVVILSRGVVKLNESMEALNRPTSKQLSVQLLADQELFVQRLSAANISASLADDGTVHVLNGDPGNLDVIWNIVRKGAFAVQSLKRARNSLEETFMSAIREAGDADS